MKNSLKILAFACAISLTFCTGTRNKIKVHKINVKAPFDMPAISYPDFGVCPEFVITDFGAVQGDQQKTSEAIANTVAAANQVGGGTVVIPKGEWLTGTIHLKSNVNLHLEKGAILLFSDNPEDYLPAVNTTWEGLECFNYSPLIYAYECTNVAITGEGELKARMAFWQQWFSRPEGHMNSLKWLYESAAKNVPVEDRQMVNDTANMRPQFIQFNRCENVLLDGVKITNSPFWTIHPYLCNDVVIRNLQVYAHGLNSDGVDPEMSQNVLIEDCVFDQGDAAIAVKSGRNQDAWRLNTPTKNLVIRNCLVKNGHQLLAVGSEVSGGVENVFMDNCSVADGASMFHLVFIKTNEQRGGFVRNIHVENIKADRMSEGILGIETDVYYQWRNLVPTYETRLTPISDIYLENIRANDVTFISRVLGQKEMPVKRVVLTNVKAGTILEDRNITANLEGFIWNQ